MAEPRAYIRETITGGGWAHRPVLAALSVPERPGGFRLLIGGGQRNTGIGLRPGPEAARIDAITGALGGVIVTGALAPGASEAVLGLDGEEWRIALQAPQTDLLEGLNCGLAITGGEPAETIAAWVRHHVETQAMQAALIIHRVRPDDSGDDLAKVLKALSGRLKGLSHLVQLDVHVPLGQPDQGDAAHPFLAPDAPGKDRMERPEPDPWRSPLGEGLIYEVARHRFLDRAAAVLHLDISDVIPPEDGVADIFSRTRATPEGAVLLSGERIYPWRVRSRAPAQYADHICRPFDSDARNRKWCVVPARSPDGVLWRMVRIGNQPASRAVTGRFLRCMAIRHPERAMGEIVPKTSLIEDEALIALWSRLGDHQPVRAPKSRTRRLKRRGHVAIVTTMKNEGPFILEWLAYHRAIGVDDFLVYTNDCDDGTDTLLDILQEKGLLQHRDNPFRQTDMKPQHAALAAADREQLIRDAEWVICMDVDEYINIHVGEGRLDDLFAAIGDANMISLTWRLFGNADVDHYADRFITSQFDLCAPELIRKPHQAWGFKTLYRQTGTFKKLGVHRPKGLKPDLLEKVRWVNGSGRPMPQSAIRNAWRSTAETYGYGLATLNHYALRSAESFLVKRDRGRVNHVDRDQGLNYWFRMNHNVEVDRSIMRMIPALQAEYDRLLADPEIAAQHAACVAAHRAKIAELKSTEAYATFHGELTGARLKNLSRKTQHFGSAVFMAGPEVIPDEIAARDLPADFFFTVKQKATGSGEGH